MRRPKVNPVDPLTEAMGLLHFAFRAVVADADRLLALRGFGRLHNRVLFFLARQGPLSVGQLLEILGISKQALHRPLAELVAARLVHVAPAGRRRLLTLTRAGVDYEARVAAPQKRRFAEAFAAVGPAAAAHWREVMRLLGGHDPFGGDLARHDG